MDVNEEAEGEEAGAEAGAEAAEGAGGGACGVLLSVGISYTMFVLLCCKGVSASLLMHAVMSSPAMC